MSRGPGGKISQHLEARLMARIECLRSPPQRTYGRCKKTEWVFPRLHSQIHHCTIIQEFCFYLESATLFQSMLNLVLECPSQATVAVKAMKGDLHRKRTHFLWKIHVPLHDHRWTLKHLKKEKSHWQNEMEKNHLIVFNLDTTSSLDQTCRFLCSRSLTWDCELLLTF